MSWDDDAPDLAKRVIVMLREPVAQFIAQLGESPEAWRGAITLTEFIRGLTKDVLGQTKALGAHDNQESTVLLALIMATMMSFYEDELTVIMRQHLGGDS